MFASEFHSSKTEHENEKPFGARAPHGFDSEIYRRRRNYAAVSIASEGDRTAAKSSDRRKPVSKYPSF